MPVDLSSISASPDTQTDAGLVDLRKLLDTLPRYLRRQKVVAAFVQLGLASPTQLLEFDNGARAWVDLRDHESRANYISQYFWPDLPRVLAPFLTEGGDFFDVGANFGLVSFGVLPAVQGKAIRFHLFEANPRIVPLLLRSAELWPNEVVTVNHGCVSDGPGVSHLTLPDGSWGHAYIGAIGMSVPNLMLDEYIDVHQIQRIAFMKMDIEGSEPCALRGARRAIAAGKVKAGLIEISSRALGRAGTSAMELLDLLEFLGFEAYFFALPAQDQSREGRWVDMRLNGTVLRIAAARPLPPGFDQSDILVVHSTSALQEKFRAAFLA